ncbi:hypothetical protein TWF281_010682 [Arthrobotrys megalospora]
MAKSNSFPEVIYNAFASSTDPSLKIQYESYPQYISKIQRNFSDIKPMETLVRFDYDRQPSTTMLYTLDIGQYSTHLQNDSYSIQAHAPINGAQDVDPHLRGAAPGTKLRMLFFFYQYLERDPAILQNLASFYDINPRTIQEHHCRSAFYSSLEVSRLSIHDTCPTYLPSEAHFSPIVLERAVRPRRKKTTILLASSPSQDFKTVLVLVSRTSTSYSRNVINRDILYPTQYASPNLLENWRQPENEAETSFLRLSRLNSMELEACVSQPLLTILPLVRNHCLETSQDVYQIQEHLGRFGLGEAGVDYRYSTNSNPDNHWGSKETDPVKAFQYINSSFTQSFRSLNDHLSFPWLDNRRPHMEYATNTIDIALKDAKRVMEEVTELREGIKESSALILAKESITEARRSAVQAESVTQLTSLAFIFIPLTFATSIFGMNIDEWQESVPRFKWFIVTAISCTTITIISAIILRKLTPSFRDWVQEHRGFWRGIGHFLRACVVHSLLVVFVSIPTRINDFVSESRANYQRRKDAKRDAAVTV